MQEADFLAVEDHFDRLVDTLPARDIKVYQQCKNTRIETAFKDRHFIVYRVKDGVLEELDRVFVNDFNANEEHGASTQIVSKTTKRTVNVGYAPVRLFDYPIFMFLPLHTKIRWGASAKTLHKGSLAFPIAIRVKSRLSPREPNVIHIETGPSFGQEFGTADRD
ncbi:MAG: hypothetical protein ACSLE8_06425 [Rhodococcus sp. (in: high G+C Gram-positive bacteria)]